MAKITAPPTLPRAFWLALALCAAAGCGPKVDPDQVAPTATTTTSALPTCPATPPSYSQTVAGVIQTNCSPCHFPGGSEVSRHDFSTYAAVQPQAGSMLNAIYSGLMPPPGAPPLSASDQNTLLTWLVCNAPNN